MPIVLRPNHFWVKDTETGKYLSTNVVGEQTADEVITRIEDAEAEIENSINVAASRAIASIPADYSALTDEVANLSATVEAILEKYPIDEGANS